MDFFSRVGLTVSIIAMTASITIIFLAMRYLVVKQMKEEISDSFFEEKPDSPNFIFVLPWVISRVIMLMAMSDIVMIGVKIYLSYGLKNHWLVLLGAMTLLAGYISFQSYQDSKFFEDLSDRFRSLAAGKKVKKENEEIMLSNIKRAEV